MSMGTQILVRAETSPLRLVHSIRTQLTAVNADQQAYNNITELDTWITDETEWQQGRLVSWIFGAFAALALALAAVGLFSVVSYTVAQRTNEFGIRMALGAQRAHVLRIVFASTFVSVGSGILIGFACTFALNRIIAKWAEGNPNNPIILLEGTVILVLVSAIACALPALRAAHLNPMAALRCE
jgi:ABC-type antimicrobial peptide transport system permease subunit